MAAELATYNTAKSHWSQKNSQGLGLIQATISNVIWQKYESLSTAKEVLDALETKFGAGQYGENTTHQFDGSINCNLITLNGHSKLSEDLATFLFCSSLPDSYEATARQYLDNITAIANYKLADVISRVLQEENR